MGENFCKVENKWCKHLSHDICKKADCPLIDVCRCPRLAEIETVRLSELIKNASFENIWKAMMKWWPDQETSKEYHLVTKAEEDKRRDLGMSILGEDYQFTRKAEEVASSPKTLFDKILDKL